MAAEPNQFWSLVAVGRPMPEVKRAAAAQGVRRFWAQADGRPEYPTFVRRIRKAFQ